MRAVIWAQHLLGTGHTVRTAALARALSAEGADVTFILGATPPPTLNLNDIDVIELPPVMATDPTFKTLRGPEGFYAELADRRRAIIEKAVVGTDVLITETYPFGRKPFKAELDGPVANVRAAGGRTVASVRDILVRKDPERQAFLAANARRLMDHVIVHAEESLTGPEDTFHMPVSDLPPLSYTGYVHSLPDTSGAPQHGGIVVTAGGSWVGGDLYEAAIAAAAFLPDGPPWHCLVPRPLAHKIPEWQAKAAANVTVAPNRSDFNAFLAGASLSISQAGYNTVLDAIAAGPPMVLVPFVNDEETEQTDRARLFAQHPGITMLPEADLTPERLAQTAAAALAGPRPQLSLAMDGAARAARRLMELIGP